MVLQLIRIVYLNTSNDISKVVLSIFKTKHYSPHHNKILDVLNTKNVHLMLVEIDSVTEKSLKKAGYKVEPQPKIVLN
jgi:hypothetical protein